MFKEHKQWSLLLENQTPILKSDRENKPNIFPIPITSILWVTK